MSAKSLRSSLAAFLIITSLLSLLPAYALSNQSSDSPKRGKNGASAKQSLPPSKETQATQDSEASSQEDNYSISKPPQKNFQNSGSQSSQTSQPQKKRREPPPFDRPPIATSPKDETSPPPRREEPRRAEPAPPSDRDADAQGEDRSGKRPPVLRRPSDSRYPAPQESEKKPQSDPDADEPIRLDATLVNIPLVVSDRSGRYIPQLGKDDFILYEDGTKQEVAFFGDERVPFNVALLLDVSPSVQGYLEDIQDAAIEFVRQLRANDRVMVVSFDRRVHFLTDLTSDRRELEYAIRRTTTGGGTSAYDAVYETIAHRLRHIEGRKALILFSDGEDTTSRQATYDDCIEIVTESDVLVYGLRYPGSGMPTTNRWPRNPIPQIPIPLPWPWPRRKRGPFTNASPAQQRWPRGRGGDFMADITEAGGGPVFDAVTVSDIGRLAARIAEELRHVYVISYYPTNPLSAGGYRSIRVRVRGRDDIAIRHRKGYNAQDVKNRT
ncbi:MAG: VWA domain-containing protein [Acidobacteriota bacterium]